MRYLIHNRDKSGTVRSYVRRYKRTVRIHAPEGAPEFKREYQAALKRLDNFKPGSDLRKPRRGPAENTLGWLALKYYHLPNSPGSTRNRSRHARPSSNPAC
jgi:hypothetical protein